MFLLGFFTRNHLFFVCLLILSGLKINIHLRAQIIIKIKKSIYKISSSERISELKIDSKLWTTPAKIINLLDFDPKKNKY